MYCQKGYCYYHFYDATRRWRLEIIPVKMAASLCWWRPWGRSPSFLRVGISTTVPKVNHLYVHNRIGIGTTVPKVARNEKMPCREVRKRNISHQFRHSMHYCASTWLQSSLPTNRTTTPLMKSDVLSDTTYSPF